MASSLERGLRHSDPAGALIWAAVELEFFGFDVDDAAMLDTAVRTNADRIRSSTGFTFITGILAGALAQAMMLFPPPAPELSLLPLLSIICALGISKLLLFDLLPEAIAKVHAKASLNSGAIDIPAEASQVLADLREGPESPELHIRRHLDTWDDARPTSMMLTGLVTLLLVQSMF